ncbi:DEAD/DEAH box helicase family protein [Aeromonas veronii]|uniref:DEAD/DEAH box helicase n=1 Tax=Aeromonas veronii TaxID=654 RepID=UPI00191D25EA|nr:DEAD/DEAH box helicase family protein [Aeromonas veronii]MBL0644909.1 DEAD/DEAH box helicase family protein [Aeromonas veronii]
MTSLRVTTVGKSTLSYHPLKDIIYSHEDVLTSWENNSFNFIEEHDDVLGLRPPQIGGIFSALGFTKSEERHAATIVMPTGTGKTETILSIVIAGKFRKTLVIVPSDALREQIRNKFLQLELLRKFKLINDETHNPIVATIKHGVKNKNELDTLLQANVIVASAASLSLFSEECLSDLTNKCSNLIVDEAHHITAMTWSKIKNYFNEKHVLQFTATPFRTDRTKIGGKIIFNYSLKKAQQDGYFKPIEFHPICEFIDENSDLEIAKKAVSLLRDDLKSNLNHIMMARTSTIERSEKLFKIYSKETDLCPVVINSKTKKKKAVLESIKAGKHKIIICVDMLGEGFDLPQLKISALHDPHKSINITLQFTGRFTRTTQDVGDAKFVANIANSNMNSCLEELYRENSDWNSIISNISSRKIQDERSYQDLKSEFSNPGKLLDLGITPTISSTIYKMSLVKWTPNRIVDFGNKYFQVVESSINDEKNLLMFSVKAYIPVAWTSSKEFFDESWDLYIAYYNKAQGLLYVHSSAKDGLVKRLVDLIAKNASQVQGECVFRALAGLKRLKLQNVGLNKNKRGLRYSMHTGTEVNEQIPDIEANRAIKSNIFGKGYENGAPVSIGCSYKGKIWAMDSDSLDKWITWCNNIGSKILDDSIDTNQVMKTAMQAEEIDKYPKLQPLSVEWPTELLRKDELKINIKTTTWEGSLMLCELLFSKFIDDNKGFEIKLKTEHNESFISTHIHSKGEVVFSSQDELSIKINENEIKLTEYFNSYPPVIFMSDTSIIDGGLRYYSNEQYAYPYSKNNIEDWDWSGIDISIESQTPSKIENSIQYHTIKKIINKYDFVFDDDGAGEVADIVAIKNTDDTELTIDIYHCKYCTKSNGVAKPGARVDDVYQVAGQAAKSIKWFGNKEELILRLISREKLRLKNKKASRIEKGNLKNLYTLARIARYATFKCGITIVQPAISKAEVSDDQLSILGATSSYIDEVSGIKLRVITSK